MALVKKVDIPKGSYVNELFTALAVDFIKQNRQQPFFLFVAYTLPHTELNVPQKYLQFYQDKEGRSLFEPEKAQPARLALRPAAPSKGGLCCHDNKHG